MKAYGFVVVAVLAAVGFLWTLHAIFYGTPLETSQLFMNQKIFYYHVPSAFVLFVAVFVCGIYSLLFLRKRDPKFDDVATSAAELSVVFGAIMLLTGMLWGRAAWGVWWVWDARLTTSLILWLIMLGVLVVRSVGGEDSHRLAAGLSVFGMANVPFVYVSVRIARTLHPPTSTVPSLDPRMRGAFWASVALFFLLFSLLLKIRSHQLKNLRRLAIVEEDMEDILEDTEDMKNLEGSLHA